MKGLRSLALKSSDVLALRDFYAALGFVFQENRVAKGSVVWRGQVGPVELVLHSGSRRKEEATPETSFRIQVEDIAGKITALRKLGIQIVLDLEFLDDGQTAVVLDPDGRSVELWAPPQAS